MLKVGNVYKAKWYNDDSSKLVVMFFVVLKAHQYHGDHTYTIIRNDGKIIKHCRCNDAQRVF